MENKEFICYEFGEFRLDVRKRSLSKKGEKVPVSSRNFDLLLFMVENGGRVLEHDELLDKVWAGIFVEQSSLKKGISALRHILEESPETEFIKTIPRRGYSFVSTVRAVPEENEVFYVRETEREIVIEEFEETDEPQSEKIKAIPSDSLRVLPSAEVKKTNFFKIAVLSIAGIAVLVLAVFGVKTYFSKNTERQFTAENVRVSRVTNSGKVVAGTAVSPDGTYILYPTAEKDGTILWLRQILANSARKLTPPLSGNFWGFAIAPDNSHVYYIYNDSSDPKKSGLFKQPLLGGDAQRIAENVSSLAISPDGKKIVLVRLAGNTTIFTVNTNGENEQIVKVLPDTYKLWSIGWTPDGTNLLCTIRNIIETKYLFYIAEMSLENGNETIVLPAQERNIFSSAWLPDKSALIVTVREPNADIRQIWQYFPGSKDWRRITNDSNSYKLANLTRDGKSIISNQESRLAAIWLSEENLSNKNKSVVKASVINRDNFRQITDGISNFNNLGWLADGRLMYAATEDGKESIFTINADGTNSRQITNGEDGIWTSPSVTGNGQNICFLSSRTGIKQVWRIDSEGKNLTKLTDAPSPILSARILSDNSSVLYTAQSKSDGILLFKQTADGQTAQLTDSDTGIWAISTDEKFLATQSLDKNTNKYRIDLRSFEDGKIIKTFDFNPVRQIFFTPDGKNLSFDVKSGDVGQIMLQSLDGGEPYALTDFQTDDIFRFGWSFDGSRLAIIRGKQLNDAVVIKANDR